MDLGRAVRREAQLAAHARERNGTGQHLLPRHEQRRRGTAVEHGGDGEAAPVVPEQEGIVRERERSKGVSGM